jgi:hypothetical protein
MLAGLAHAALVKVSEEELAFLTGEEDMRRAADRLWHDRSPELTPKAHDEAAAAAGGDTWAGRLRLLHPHNERQRAGLRCAGRGYHRHG